MRRSDTLLWLYCSSGILAALAFFAAALAFWEPHPTRAIVVFALGLVIPMVFVPLGVLVLAIRIEEGQKALAHESLALATNAKRDREHIKDLLGNGESAPQQPQE